MSTTHWMLVKTLFHGALEQPVEHRASWLARNAPPHTGVRSEVERLLTAHVEAGSFIDRPPGIAPDPVTEPPRTDYTGRQLGHYRIEHLIANGGMGEVYEARDLELGRNVAIKLVRSQNPDEQIRLRREARHASRLNHPHVCTIHEAGVSDGQAFIVMERITGRPLRDVILTEGLGLEGALRHGAQIADALAHAHEHGVLHGDLTSANVVITPDGRAKILDFGLARRVAAPGGDSPSASQDLERQGQIAGTLSYMAPESLRGATGTVQTDIWSLGVVLYEMATGRRPFTGGTSFDVSAAILHEPPAALPPSIPADVAAVIHTCLAKDPRERYRSAADVRGALEAVSARPPRSPAQIAGRWRTWPAIVAVASAVVALIWAAARFGSSRDPVGIGVSGRPAIAVMSFDNPAGSRDLGWLSDGLPSLLLTGLAESPGLDVVSVERLREAAARLGQTRLDDMDDDAASEAARRAGAGAIVTGAFFENDDGIRIDLRVEDLQTGRILTAARVTGNDVFALADDLIPTIRGALGAAPPEQRAGIRRITTSSLEAYRLYSEAQTALNNARNVDARVLLQQAIRLDSSFAMAYYFLSLTSERLGEEGTNSDYLQKAQELSDRLPERLRLLVEATSTARVTGRAADAARLFEQLIARYPDQEMAYVHLQNLYHEMDEPRRALEIASRGVEAFPNDPSTRNSLGYALLGVGRYEEALAEFERYAELTPREPNPYDSAGEAYLVMGEPNKAIAKFRQALAVDPGFGSRANLSWALAMLGRYDEALAEIRRFQDILAERQLPITRPLSQEALLVSRLGRYREARSRIDTARALATTNGQTLDIVGLDLLSALLALERDDPAGALADAASAESLLASLPQDRIRWLSREGGILVDFVAGIAEAQSGDLPEARGRLARIQRTYRTEDAIENWWCHTLEGEIELAAGALDAAESAFHAAEPRGFVDYGGGPERGAFLQLFRDGLARTRARRGDLAGAVDSYRSLLTPSRENPWRAALAPRAMLAMARLFEEAGDHASARAEAQRFLGFWKDADPGLPEVADARRIVGLSARLAVPPTPRFVQQVQFVRSQIQLLRAGRQQVVRPELGAHQP